MRPESADENSTRRPADLRRRAEEVLRQEAADAADIAPEEARRLLHELHVHQIELEVQNEELRRAQDELEASRARYFDLFDLAPVGYLTLTEPGLILEANLTVATLLGVARRSLVQQPISRFILPEDQDIWYLHHKQLFDAGEACELRMLRTDAAPFWARLEGTLAQDADGVPMCRVAMGDITESKRAEAALRESEHSFRTLAENLPAIVYRHSLAEGRTQFFNQALQAVTGYGAGELPAGGMCPIDPLIVQEDRPQVLDTIEAAVAAATEFRVEYRIRRKDGQVRHLVERGQPIQAADGQPSHINGIIVDITESKRVAEALRESEERYRRIAHAVTDYLFTVRFEDGRPVETLHNPACVGVTGYSPEEFAADPGLWLRMVHEEDRAVVVERASRVASGQDTQPIEHRIVRRDGATRWVRSSVVPHRNAEGKLVSYDGMLSDITERRRAEQALADAARFPAENPHPVLRIAGDGTLLYANAPSASLLDEWGCAPGGSVPEAWRERVAQALVSAKGLRVDIEHQGLMLSFEIVPILRAGYVNLYGRDVTEQKRAEKALRESERKYRDVVENLNEGLWAIDQEGRTTYVNRRMAEMLGYTEEEMLGRPLFSFMDEASVESCRRNMARRQQGIREVHTFEFLRKDGARVWTQLSTGPVLDPQGAYAGAIAGVIDITDLHRAEQNYRALFENMVDGFALHEIICDSEGRPVDYRFLAANPTFERLTGLKAADMVGKTVREVLPGIEPSWIETYGRVALTGETAHFERYSGELGKHFEVEAYPFGERRFATVFVDITDRKHIEAERAITLDLLRLIGSQNDLHGLMREVTRLLREWSECDAVGIRLREGDDFPYFETRGFPAEFVEAESQLCARDTQGYPMRDSAGNPVLECMCGNVLCGRFDPAKPFFTANGSFWSNCTTDLLATTTEGDRQTRTRNRCNAEGYESVALIALRAGNATLGLLQLNDRQKGRFTPERIALLERLATSLGVAIAHRHAQAEVREREERFRDLAEMLPEIIYETDLSGRLTFVNRQAFEMFGYTPAHLAAGLNCLDMLIPADRPRGAAGMQKVMQGVADRGTDYTAIRKDGSTFPILIFSAAVEREGRPAGLRGIIVDIGQLKEAERQLLAYQGELQSLASELTLAEERERRRLAVFLHDDLGQSLAMAKLKLQEARQAAPGGAWTLLLTQANDLLALVIRNTRALTMDLSPPILYELGLEPALEWLAERASGQGGIEAAFEDDGQPKPVSDEARLFLFRAVRELLANVAKHAQARRVRVAIARAGDSIRITVEDDGVGIDVRGLGTLLQRGAFGLFNVRERIGHLGGAFEIASKLGQGTRVVLTAPLRADG